MTSEHFDRKPDGVIRGARVSRAKRELAHRLKREMTVEERLLWEQLRRNQLNGLHFRRQQVISGFVADFYCHAARLMVEVDGPIHLSRRNYDADRDDVLVSRGFRVLRITSEEVRSNMRGVLRRIAKAVEPAEGQTDRDANKLDAELKGR